MAAFDFTALNPKGRTEKGTLEGDSARQVRQQLREKGWVPLEIHSTAQNVSIIGGIKTSRRRMSAYEVALVTRQLATLVQAGLPLEEALKAIARQHQNGRIHSIILGVRARVIEGLSLSQALNSYPQAFSKLFRSTVAAGEHSGHLDLILERLADYTERSYDTQRRIKGALIYPVVLVLFSLAILIGLLRFVVPKIVNVFEGSGQALPFLTQALIGVSNFVGNWWWLILLMIFGLIFGWQFAMRSENIRFKWHQLILRLPFAAHLSRSINSSRVAGTLSILTASGVQLVDALGIAGEVASNEVIRGAVVTASDRVREGSSLHRALSQTDHFPPMLVQMIASGERSGELDKMLERAARNQERELETLISTSVALFEPLMMVFMGILVLVIVLAIMLPIINLNSLIG
ncbi:MAG: type II secretion system inner membrane protein GspF, partial [Pseudomonadota bacterium]